MPEALTIDEQESLSQLKKVCARHGRRVPATIQSCALLKEQLLLEERQKTADLESMGRNRLPEPKQKALAFVSARINQLQNEGIFLNVALLKASDEYDAILAARAAQNVSWSDIVAGLAVATLPEIKLIGQAMSRFLPREVTPCRLSSKPTGWSQWKDNFNGEQGSWRDLKRDLQDSTATCWGDLVREVEKVTVVPDVRKTTQDAVDLSKRTSVSFVSTLDNASKDIFEAFKNPIPKNARINEQIKKDSQMRFNGLNARNQILTAVIEKLRQTVVLASMLETVFHRFIFWYTSPDLISVLESLFDFAGLMANSVTDRALELFPEILLYDMLRAYVKTHVDYELEVSQMNKSLRELPDSVETRVYGLDSSQTNLIYSRFSTTPWIDSTRPPIRNFRDLIEHWDAKTVLMAREKAASNGRLGPMLSTPRKLRLR